MAKIKVNPQPLVYPNPAVLVGAKVDGKPNFMTAAWCGVACSEPPMISVGIRPARYTYGGIRENMSFSVSIPSTDQVAEADYCGIQSGAAADKAKVCGFTVFYGKTGTAPLIEQCPVTMDCRVVHLLDLGTHILVVGRVEETYVSEECMTDGKPDPSKFKPFAFFGGQYLALGPSVGKAFGAGLELKKREG